MTPIRFTLRQLQYFAAVARTGQMSLAAAEMHVTQSTMTAAIAELERVMGVLLFERGRTGVTLTFKGHLFLQQAQGVLDAALNAAREPFSEHASLSGTLELAASYTVLGYFLLPFIARFQKLHPDVRIVPRELGSRQIERELSSGKIELAVALTSNLQDLRLLQRKVLVRSPRQLWVAADHPLADRSLVSFDDMAPYAYVLPAVDDGDVAARAYWKKASLAPAAFLRTTSMEAVREMVALGLGVTLLSDMVFRPWSLDGRRIRTVPLAQAIQPMEVGAVWQKGHRLGPVARALVDDLALSSGASRSE